MHDSHIHISMSPLKENLETDLNEFIQEGGKKILAQTTDITNYQDTIELYDKFSKRFANLIDLALGIHPSRIEEGISKNNLEETDIFKFTQKQYELFEEVFNKNITKVKAIGECGLDYYTMEQYYQFSEDEKDQIKEAQRRMFSKLCKLAIKHNLPMSIHARGSENDNSCIKDILLIIAKEGKGALQGSFHSYTGDIKLLNEILNLGMYIGFNAIITYPSGDNVREILNKTPLERILFETDGPFLPTQSVRKKKKSPKKYGRPVLIREIMEKASEIKGVSVKKMEEISDKNYITLFGQ